MLWENNAIIVLQKPPYWICAIGSLYSDEAIRAAALPTTKSREELVQSHIPEQIHHWVSLSFEHPCAKSVEFQWGIAHRLDVSTSGCLLLAKTPKSFVYLRDQFHKHLVRKDYIALVHGEVKDDKGTIDKPIHYDFGTNTSVCKEGQGKPALSYYTVQGRLVERATGKKFTMVQVKIVTGRTHQIRVHMQSIGHPIVSDSKYTPAADVDRDKKWCSRIFLHAWRVGFFDQTRTVRQVEAPLQSDLARAIQHLTRVDRGGFVLPKALPVRKPESVADNHAFIPPPPEDMPPPPEEPPAPAPKPAGGSAGGGRDAPGAPLPRDAPVGQSNASKARRERRNRAKQRQEAEAAASEPPAVEPPRAPVSRSPKKDKDGFVKVRHGKVQEAMEDDWGDAPDLAEEACVPDQGLVDILLTMGFVEDMVYQVLATNHNDFEGATERLLEMGGGAGRHFDGDDDDDLDMKRIATLAMEADVGWDAEDVAFLKALEASQNESRACGSGAEDTAYERALELSRRDAGAEDDPDVRRAIAASLSIETERPAAQLNPQDVGDDWGDAPDWAQPEEAARVLDTPASLHTPAMQTQLLAGGDEDIDLDFVLKQSAEEAEELQKIQAAEDAAYMEAVRQSQEEAARYMGGQDWQYGAYDNQYAAQYASETQDEAQYDAQPFQANEEMCAQLCGMGFPYDKVQATLLATGNDFDKALDELIQLVG